MDAVISRRRCAQFLAASGITLATGCTSFYARQPAREGTSTDPSTMVQTTPDPLHIVYRTRTDRLNLAGAALPHCSIAELRLDFPHYERKVAVCSATVQTTPCSTSATPFPERGVTSAVTSWVRSDASPVGAEATQSWSSDIPLWEAEAIVASLEKLNFFRKQRTVLSAQVFLSVETGKHAVGKKYRPVDELDAMILRIVKSTETAEIAPSAAAPLAHLPTREPLQRLPAL